MTLLFRSMSCRLGGVNSPPSPPSWDDDVIQQHEQFEEEEEEEMRDVYNPISTPFLRVSPGGGRSKEIINGIGKSNTSTSSSGNNSGQFPFLTFVVAALRKSLITSCTTISTSTTTTVDTDNDDVSSSSSSLDISPPTNVRHVSHVTFDRFNGFLGLPQEFHPQLPRKPPSASASVFGVSPLSMQCSIDERGNSVPTILIMMQTRLYEEGGLQAEGIFRINAENSQEEFVRNQLNKGVIPEGIDVHCLAGLIKAWFRELPKGVLDSLTAEQVMHCNTEDQCTQLVQLLPQTEAALLNWAINLMADVVHNEQHNKMNARNIAMVFAPNMTQMADPLTALIHAVQVMNFLKTLIVRTLRLREETQAEVKMLSSYADTLNTSTNRHPSMSIADVLFQEKHHIYREETQSIKLSRSVTLDRLEFSPKQKHGMIHRKNDEQGKEYACFSSDSSPVTESKHESKEVEGILDRLNFRKGVKKLCRHPVFQLNKPAKKITELEIVNSI